MEKLGPEHVYLSQSADNGFEFDEGVEEFEEFKGSNPESSKNDLSSENYFLSIVLAVVILLGIFLYVTRKKRMARGLDSQVVKSS